MDFDVKFEFLREEWKERGDGIERVFKWIELRVDMMKIKMIVSVCRVVRFFLIIKDSEIFFYFFINDVEFNNNCFKLVKKYIQLGFNGMIEVV